MNPRFIAAHEISRWLPFTTSPFFVEDYYGNRTLYPQVVGTTKEYAYLEQAILRAILRKNVEEAVSTGNKKEELTTVGEYITITEKGIVINSTMFGQVVDPRDIAHIVLDGLEPSSTYILASQPETVLCYALCLEGTAFSDQTKPEEITITANGKKTILSISFDTLVWCMDQPGTEAIIDFSFHTASIDGKKNNSIPVVFGEVGLVIDSRGRPFDVPQDTSQGRERVKKWLGATAEVHLLQ